MNYKENAKDIKIILKIKGKEIKSDNCNKEYCQNLINPKLLIQVFDSIENALYDSDRVDVEMFFKKYAESLNIPSIYRDAALQRIREYRHNRLRLTDAKSGSIELYAYVIAGAYFVLNMTLKETIKEGYKQTDFHKNLANFIKDGIDSKALYIAEKIRKSFSKKKRDVIVRSLPPADIKPNTIEVDILDTFSLVKHEKPEKTLGEIIKE